MSNKRWKKWRTSKEEAKKRKRSRGNADSAVLEIVKWCDEAGVTFTRFNGGLHWRFEHASGIVEWWPSTGKMVDDKKFEQSKIAQDWKEMLSHVASRFW